jgi:hypothetical protein
MGTHSSTAYDIVALSIAKTGGAACDHSSSDLFDLLPSTLLRIFDTTGISVGARGVLADMGMTRQDCGIYNSAVKWNARFWIDRLGLRARLGLRKMGGSLKQA